MTELVWVLVAMFEPRAGQPDFHAFDSYVQQHDLPAKRFQADPDTRALIVPLASLLGSSDEVQSTMTTAQAGEPTETAAVVLSAAVGQAGLGKLVDKIRQVDASPGTVLMLPDSVETSAMGVGESRGSITLQIATGPHRYLLYQFASVKPGLRMSPEGMRKVPEDKDYLKDRESWFRERYKKSE